MLDNIEMNRSLTDHVERLMREKTIDEVAAEKQLQEDKSQIITIQRIEP